MKTTLPKKTSRPEEDAIVAGVRISHPGKILWPASKAAKAITKLDLARYFESVAPRMLPHIEGRPISMVRAPEGLTGERFFQRHALMGNAARFTLLKVKGEKKLFLSAGTKEALVALAQAAVLELHPWGSKKGDPETPARIVFDLDPAPGLNFDAVIACAKELRERLSACGLTPFAKTTGGKGMHVMVAIKGTPGHPATWRDAKEFSRELCEQMERDSPSHYTTTVSKKARGGKIFLDYLRNDRLASSVAPWSPRARESAPIAKPLEWAELRTGLMPNKFTIENMRIWLKRGDPWKDIDRTSTPLYAAVQKLK